MRCSIQSADQASQAPPDRRPCLSGWAGDRVAALIAALVPLAIAASTWAQAQGAPPEPRVTRTYPVWVGYAIGAVLIVIVVMISLMPSKRAHQD